MSLLTSLALAASSSAQSYEQLWKQVEAKNERDLPQSALQSVEQILAKATNEQNSVQQLRATLMKYLFEEEISPDSAQLYLQQIEKSIAQKERPAVKALWHAALAQCILAQSENGGYYEDKSLTYEATQKKARAHFEAALSDLDVLAQVHTKDFLPLFNEGPDSRYFPTTCSTSFGARMPKRLCSHVRRKLLGFHNWPPTTPSIMSPTPHYCFSLTVQNFFTAKAK